MVNNKEMQNSMKSIYMKVYFVSTKNYDRFEREYIFYFQIHSWNVYFCFFLDEKIEKKQS